MPQATTADQAGRPARLRRLAKAVIDLANRDPRAPLGQPQRGMLAGAVAGADLTDILLERLGRPRHHRGHRAPLRRAAFHRLAVSHMAHTVATQLRNGRVDREVVDVQIAASRRAADPSPGFLTCCMTLLDLHDLPVVRRFSGGVVLVAGSRY